MVDITKIDHVEEGLSKLPSQWDNATVLRGLLTSFLSPLGDLEDNIIGVRDGFNVNTAVGAQLDIIGYYFEEVRAGRSDTDFRAAILAKISSSNGSGTPDQLLDLYASITNTSDVKIWEHYPFGIVMLSTAGDDVNPDLASYIVDSTAGCMEIGGLYYDPYGYVWIPKDTQSSVYNLIDNNGDLVVTDVPDEIVVNVNLEEPDDGNARSRFVDKSQDGTATGGYGIDYGLTYGGQNLALFSQFCECSILGNGLITNGGNGFVEWAGDSELDPNTGTTNKAIPIKQLQSSGLKRRQPLARQFFNWMMANIDDWFKLLSDRTKVGAIRIRSALKTDVATTEADFDARFGGTWAYVGTQVYAGETLYVFKRTA